MEELTAYCLPLRKRCEILEPRIVTMKNGRKAVRGKAKDAPQHTIFRIVSDAEAEKLESVLNK